jgi:hypothetical protein
MKLPFSYHLAEGYYPLERAQANRNLRTDFDDYPRLHREILGWLEEAVDFDFSKAYLDDQTLEDYFQYGLDAAKADLFQPPFETMHFVFPYTEELYVPLTVLWDASSRALIVITYFCSPVNPATMTSTDTFYLKKPFKVTPCNVWYVTGFGTPDESESSLPLISDLGAKTVGEDSVYALSRHTARAAIAYIGLLDSKQAEKRWNEAPVRLNKQRATKGRRPIPACCVVRLNLTSGGSSHGSAGERAPPRLHRRRGHIRHLPLKAIKIPPCIVGADKGFRDTPPPRPTYKVVTGNVSGGDAL